jgi:hypothetical protein
MWRGAHNGWSPHTGPPRWRGHRRPARQQGVEAPVGVAQVRKGENAGQGGTSGATEGWQTRRGTVAFWGSAMSCGGRQRWWSAPRALVNGGEVRSGGNLGRKPRGSRAHHEAELVAMAAPKPADWHGVRCPRQASRACGANERVTVLELGRRARKRGKWGSSQRF